MFHKLVRNVMIAAMIHGSDAKCEDNQADLMAYVRSSVSAACLPLVAADVGAPPACAANSLLCGMMMTLDYQYDCVGSSCGELSSAQPLFKFGDTQSRNFPQQVCLPTACNNDADMAVYKNFTQHSLQNSLCSSLSSLASSSTTNEASIDAQVSATDLQLSCDKDAQGQIMIDGLIIPTPAPDERCEPCDGADGCGNFYSETECRSASQGCQWHADACPEDTSQTTSPIDETGASMTTCGDMRRAYKMVGCCGNPTKTFSMPDGMKRRRLSSEEELLESVKAALQNAEEVGGPSKARSLAKAVRAILSKLD